MGYNLSFIAIRGLEREEVWERLFLKCSGVASELRVTGNGLAGGLLKSGWYVVCSKPDARPCPVTADFEIDTTRYRIEIDSETMIALSKNAEVLLLYVQEHCMLSLGSYWRNSVEQWRVILPPDETELIFWGEVPSMFETMRQAVSRNDQAALFDLPVKLFDQYVDFRYDYNESKYLDGEPDYLTTRKKKH